jgi:hypothetical protein
LERATLRRHQFAGENLREGLLILLQVEGEWEGGTWGDGRGRKPL